MGQVPGDTQRVLEDMTDRQLMESYAGRQDCQAFGAFVGRHESALLSYAAVFLRDDSLAQDVVQEAFLRAASQPQRILSCDGRESSIRNWLLKVVRDLSIDSLRRRASERKAVAGLAVSAEKSAPAADSPLEAREEAQTVRDCIDRLKPRWREVLILKVREQKSYKEIAQITGLTVTNVGFLLHQAMQALAEELKE